MKKKKICLITNWYPTEENPFQGLFFREQAIALEKEFDFVVLHYEVKSNILKEYAKLDLIKAEYNIKEYKSTICYNKVCRKVYSAFNPDKEYCDKLFEKICQQLVPEEIDIFYSICGQSEAAKVAQYANYFNKPYVIGEHGPFPWPNTLLLKENKDAIEKADLFFAISNDKVRQIMMQNIKLPSIRYVGNLVDDTKFRYKESGNKIKTFVAVGAHVFYKNYPMMIETFNKLTEITDVPFHILIIGYKANKGYSNDGEKLEQAIAKSKFAECVELVPSVPHDELPEYYNKSDAFIMTSIQEGQPVSAMEAACCGLPIFATRCGGVEDYINEECGRIVGILDSDELASYLKDYLEGNLAFNPEIIRETICRRFGKEAFVENMKSAFYSVI